MRAFLARRRVMRPRCARLRDNARYVKARLRAILLSCRRISILSKVRLTLLGRSSVDLAALVSKLPLPSKRHRASFPYQLAAKRFHNLGELACSLRAVD